MVATVWNKFVNVAKPFKAGAATVPCRVPAPLARAAVTTVLLSELIRLPNASSILTTGCCAKATPAVAALEGWVCTPNREAAAALTAMPVEVAPVRVPLANCIVMFVATLCERFVKVTTPPLAVRLVLPCNAPLPAPRLALTTVELSLLRKLPYASSIRSVGCCAKTTPAVAVLEGCVTMVSLLAAPGPTTTVDEVAPIKLLLLKLMFIVSTIV